jgi:hypothetical protein
MSAVLVASLMGAMSAGAMTQPAPQVTVNAPKRAKKGLFGGIQLAPRTSWSYGGPGTTAAQIKRASKKARNVARHKKHAR